MFYRLFSLALATLLVLPVAQAQNPNPYWDSRIYTNDLIIRGDGTLNYEHWASGAFGIPLGGNFGSWRNTKISEIEIRISPTVLAADATSLNNDDFRGDFFMLTFKNYASLTEEPFAASEDARASYLSLATNAIESNQGQASQATRAELENFNQQAPSTILYLVRDSYLTDTETTYGASNVIRFGAGQEINSTLQEIAAAATLLWDKYDQATPTDIHNALVNGRFTKSRKLNIRRAAYLLGQQFP